MRLVCGPATPLGDLGAPAARTLKWEEEGNDEDFKKLPLDVANNALPWRR